MRDVSNEIALRLSGSVHLLGHVVEARSQASDLILTPYGDALVVVPMGDLFGSLSHD